MDWIGVGDVSDQAACLHPFSLWKLVHMDVWA